jgi:phospholipid/cholesterol/gamma-HCH transport system substrate-binding protein
MTRKRASVVIPRVAALAALAVLVVILYDALFGAPSGYVVYAKFGDASGLLTAYNVKVGGVTAGEVMSIGLDSQDHAVVKMDLDHGAYPIGAGATAEIRPVNLLGEKYVDLNPGNLSRPQPSGTTIPLGRTSTPVELDDVLNMFAPDVLARLQIIVNEAGIAMAGNGANFSQTLGQLPPTLQQARKFVAQIGRQNRQLGTLLDAGSAVIGSVNSRRSDLDGLVSSAAGAFQTVAARRAQLGQTVQNAPAALAQLTKTLDELGTTAGALYPAMVQLRAAAPPLASVLAQAPTFATDAQSALAAAQAIAPLLVRLGRLGTPVLEHAIPTVRRLATFASSLRTVMTGLDQGGSMKALLSFIAGWAGVIQQRDGIGNMFRVHITLSPQLVTSVLQSLGASADASLTAGRRTAQANRSLPAPPGTPAVPSKPSASGTGTANSSAATGSPAPGGGSTPTEPSAPGGSPATSTLQSLLGYLLH